MLKLFCWFFKGNVYVANVNPGNLVSESWVHVGNSGITDEILLLVLIQALIPGLACLCRNQSWISLLFAWSKW